MYHSPIGENFDILFALHGFAVGLAITRLLQFLGQIAISRDKKYRDAFQLIWLTSLIIFTAQYWFYAIKWKSEVKEINFNQYLLSILIPMLLYLMSSVICPTREEIGKRNPGDYFEANSWILFIFIGIFLFLASAESVFIQNSKGLAYPSENICRYVFGVIFILVGILHRKYRKEIIPLTLLFVSVGFRIIVSRYPI